MIRKKIWSIWVFISFKKCCSCTTYMLIKWKILYRVSFVMLFSFVFFAIKFISISAHENNTYCCRAYKIINILPSKIYIWIRCKEEKYICAHVNNIVIWNRIHHINRWRYYSSRAIEKKNNAPRSVSFFLLLIHMSKCLYLLLQLKILTFVSIS